MCECSGEAINGRGEVGDDAKRCNGDCKKGKNF